MIEQIRKSPCQKYDYINHNYEYYKNSPGHGWKNTDRCILSSNYCFVRTTLCPGIKYGYWSFLPVCAGMFDHDKRRRVRARSGSGVR
ncbi:hypothetical protein FKM82_007283 [Ascaphus truei]